MPSAQDVELQAAVSALRERDGAWMSVHVLYSACRCSNQVLDHLFSADRARPEGVDERVLLVGANAEIEARAARAGLPLSVLEPRELEAQFGITSAPLLLLVSPSDELRYAGGYSDRKQSLDIQYLQILDEARGVHSPRVRPLFGCGVSRELQAALDPLGLKYDRPSSP